MLPSSIFVVTTGYFKLFLPHNISEGGEHKQREKEAYYPRREICPHCRGPKGMHAAQKGNMKVPIGLT